MNGWKEYELQNIVERFIDYRGKTPEKTMAGIPLVTAKIVKNGKIETPTEFIAVNNYTAWMRRGYPEINDVVMTTEAPLGEVALLKNKNVALAQRIIVIRGKKGICDNPFLKYYLQSPFGQEELQGRASGTTVEGIKAAELRKITVFLPPLPEQRAIAGVLASLDDKIDLLHRQNKTLEGMAEALWRKMFVEEADPTWKYGKLGDYIKTTSGGTPSRSHSEYFENGIFKWVKSKELQGTFIIDTEEYITAYALKNSSAKLLPKNTLLLAMYGATVGEYGILTDQGTCNQAICALLPNENYPYTFIFMFLKINKEEIINHAVGSAQQNISQIVVQNFEFLSPNKTIIQFHEMADSLFNKIKCNIFQIHSLSKLRDSLLPKLMSGEIRV